MYIVDCYLSRRTIHISIELVLTHCIELFAWRALFNVVLLESYIGFLPTRCASHFAEMNSTVMWCPQWSGDQLRVHVGVALAL